MDNTPESQAPNSSGTKWLIPSVVVGIIVIAAIAFFALGMNNTQTTTTTQPTPEAAMQATTAPTSTDTAPVTGTEGAATQADYKDGTYQATGSYVTPGGPREVAVTVTLKDGVVTAATFQGFATDPNSKRFQGEFQESFQPEVVGKNIDEVSVTKVAGSSLSPKGFMDALDQIKTEAQA